MIHWIVSLLLALSGIESKIVSEISGPAMIRDLQYITQFDRISGGEGEARSVDYIVGKLKEAGVPVEVHEFDSLLSWPGPSGLEIVSPEARKIDAITFAFGKSTPASGLEGEVVLAQFEGQIGLASQTRVKAEGLRGKIAFVEGRAFPHVFRQVEEAGAIGAIFTSDSERLIELIVTTVWGTPATNNANLMPSALGVTIKKSDGQYLKSLLGKGPARARLKATVDTRWRRLRLPVATVQGRNPGQFILVGTHIDAWHRGGTDAGASNIIALELARVFQKHRAELRRSIKIAWWPGHSTGRYSGSAWYADHMFKQLDRGAIAHVNMDGLGSRGARVYQTQNTAEFDALAKAVLRDAVNAEGPIGRPNRNSDQSFLGIGIPSLQIDDEVPDDVGGYWWWHTAEDTFDKADEKIMVRDAGAVAVALARLAAAPLIPYRFSDVAAQITSRLNQYQKQAASSFSLAPALESARAFESAAKQLDQYTAAAIPESRLNAVNDQLIRLTRVLNPLLYTVSGRYHPDDANPKVLIPGLAAVYRSEGLSGDSLKFAETYLVRERNRVVSALDRATEIARSVAH